MSDTPTIPPALTPEQWKGHRQCGAFVSGSLFRCEVGGAEIEDAPRHALAALCLYGQPFGFTPAEEADLTDLLNLVDWDSIEGVRDSLASVLAKVRALLPLGLPAGSGCHCTTSQVTT